MLPIRGESDSWRASHLSTLPPRPTFPPSFLLHSLHDPPFPSFPLTLALLYNISLHLLLFLLLSSFSPGEGGLSPLQITDTKRRWWRRWRWELLVQGPVSINEPMKVYFARMHVLNSFLCDSWLGNVSVNLIKDSAGSHYFLSTPVPDGVKVHHLHPWLVQGAAPAPEQAPFSFLFSCLFFFNAVCLLRGVIFLHRSPSKDTLYSMFQNDRDAKVYSKATYIFTKHT